MTHLTDPAPWATTTAQPNDWRAAGLCRSHHDPDLWFAPPTDPASSEARRICQACPVLQTCHAWALETREKWGTWGGLDTAERASLLGVKPPHDYDTTAAPEARKPKPRQPPTECGTPDGYARHHRHKEAVCAACKDAFVAAGGVLPTVGGSHRKPIDHGTVRGYYQHQNRHETPCEACRKAYNEHRRNKKQGGKPGRPAGPIAHGTRQGAFAHKHRKIPLCEPCRDAMNAYEQERRTTHRTTKKAAA